MQLQLQKAIVALPGLVGRDTLVHAGEWRAACAGVSVQRLRGALRASGCERRPLRSQGVAPPAARARAGRAEIPRNLRAALSD